jgi:hypothetical protein
MDLFTYSEFERKTPPCRGFLRRLAQGGHLSALIERRGQPHKLDVLIE